MKKIASDMKNGACNSLAKEDLEKILVLLEDRKLLLVRSPAACANCAYWACCDEHVRCTDGLAKFLYRGLKEEI